MHEHEAGPSHGHSHVFLGAGHEQGERAMWAVIALTSVMMVVEIVGGAMFGSIALVADGFHMSTHAGALLLAALAYTLARRRADDPRYTFGTGKFGDLAGFSSALILAMIALAIGYESAIRLWAPTPIDFNQAIPIAALGLIVNVASAWLLSRGGHDHHHHGDAHAHHHHDETRALILGGQTYVLSIFEEDVPPRFRLAGANIGAGTAQIETRRPDGSRQVFEMVEGPDFLESVDEIPEPHAFDVVARVGAASAVCQFEEHADHDHAIHHDHNMRAAIMHVLADAAVSVFVIVGLTLAKMFGWLWMDPLAGLVGAFVIASWALTLIRDTGRVLLDMNPDVELTSRLRRALERDGDEVADLHVWRLGPGHLGAIVSLVTDGDRDVEFFREAARRQAAFSHLTIEIARRPARHEGPRLHVA